MGSNKVLGVIPARFASTRFPGKMLAPLLGKSLIQTTYENAKKASLLDELVIATDDARIFDHVKAFGGQVFMTDPEAPSGTDRVAELVFRDFPEAEIIVNIQGDEPLLNPAVIDALIQALKNDPEACMQTPVTLIKSPKDLFSTSVVKCVFDRSGRALYFSRAPIPFVQKEQPVDYYRHIGVYCFKREFLKTYLELPRTRLQKIEDLEQLKVLEHGFPLHVTVVENEDGIGVDTPEDLKKVEERLCKENTSLLQAALSPL